VGEKWERKVSLPAAHDLSLEDVIARNTSCQNICIGSVLWSIQWGKLVRGQCHVFPYHDGAEECGTLSFFVYLLGYHTLWVIVLFPFFPMPLDISSIFLFGIQYCSLDSMLFVLL